MCFELGRFPFELPAGLPDEQIVLMVAYLELRAELQRGDGRDRAIERAARAGEAQLQADEAAAWKNVRGR